MAHPLTVHPPSTLPFQSATRPSPLGFGFGIPSGSSPLSFGLNNRPTLGGFGFGGPSTTSGSPSKRSTPTRPVIPSINTSPANFRSTPSASLKRPRRSPSPTPSSSPSPTTSSLPSPHPTHGDLPKGREKDDLSVGLLALKDGDRRVRGRKDVKRLRKDIASSSSATLAGTGDMDVGVLLAALPPSAHLPILLNLLAANPSLNADILSRLPQPDQHECLAQLAKYHERIKQSAGSSNLQLNPDRAWSRVRNDVDEYCKMATTYINYFSSSSQSQSSPEPQTIHSLLYSLSTQIYFLLRLIPRTTDTNAGTARHLLNLGKTVIASWNQWLTALSAEVNQRGGMYPHSIVESWADNLDSLSTSQSTATSSWSAFNQTAESSAHHLVDSFQSAMVPIRDRFVVELGWLVGRRPPQPPMSSSQHTSSYSNHIPSPWNNPPNRAVTAGAEEEEL